MLYLKVETATIHSLDYKALRAAWRLHGSSPLAGTFTTAKPLTAAQLRRLPAGLRRRLPAALRELVK